MIRSLVDQKDEELKERQKLLQMSEVSLWLYGYEDIFSDFDPRPYSQRALSEDFLTEAKRIVREKSTGEMQLKFSVPVKSRDAEKEKIIVTRLREHFRKHHALLHHEKSNKIRDGIAMAVLGLSMMLAASYIRFLNSAQFLFNLLFVLIEPSGWFVAWYGFDQILHIRKNIRQDLDFYDKMTKADIGFVSY